MLSCHKHDGKDVPTSDSRAEVATVFVIVAYSSASGPRSRAIQKPARIATVASTMQRSASGAMAVSKGLVNAL